MVIPYPVFIVISTAKILEPKMELSVADLQSDDFLKLPLTRKRMVV